MASSENHSDSSKLRAYVVSIKVHPHLNLLLVIMCRILDKKEVLANSKAKWEQLLKPNYYRKIVQLEHYIVVVNNAASNSC